MFEAAVDGPGGPQGGVIEVGQDVPGSAFECPAQCDLRESEARPRRRGGSFRLSCQGLTAVFAGIAIGVG